MKKIMTLLVLLAAAQGSSLAHAINYITGADCDALSPDSTSVYKSSHSAGIQNTSGSTKTIICPIREQGWLDNVWAADIIVSENVDWTSCRLKARWWGNAVKSWAPTSKSVVQDNGRVTISWGASETRTVSGPVYITCSVPNYGWIYYANIQMN